MSLAFVFTLMIKNDLHFYQICYICVLWASTIITLFSQIHIVGFLYILRLGYADIHINKLIYGLS